MVTCGTSHKSRIPLVNYLRQKGMAFVTKRNLSDNLRILIMFVMLMTHVSCKAKNAVVLS